MMRCLKGEPVRWLYLPSMVRIAQGPKVKFTYVDYGVKIVLGSILRKYVNLDQVGNRPAVLPAPSYYAPTAGSCV